jgi:uroporphyrinogen-III synthase
MRIIVTRPEEDAGPLAERLKSMGHEPLLLPLMKIVPRPAVALPTKAYQFICLTSANGARSLRSIAGQEDTPLIAIGAQSLLAATKAGFTNTSAQGGDVEGLANFVIANFYPQSGPVLYLSGSTISGDLESELKQAGFLVDRLITYDAVPTGLEAHISQIEFADAVLLYSPRAAKIWCEEMKVLKLEKSVSIKKHYCLSDNVAAALPQSWPKRIAREPIESALLDLLD